MNAQPSNWPRWLHAVLLIGMTSVLAYAFANVEIQIEGSAGWAINLPTWRIEKHWLLDIFLAVVP